MRQKLQKAELIDQFLNQIKKIKIFCELFDAGDENISQEIAVKCRILFHNTNHSKSLVRQLKLEHIQLYDNCKKYKPKNLFSHWGLVTIQSQMISQNETESKWIPRIENTGFNLVDFKNWWDGKKIIVDSKKNIFTRKKLLLEVANTDGGAHVDTGLKIDYRDLSRNNSLDFYYGNSETNQIPLNNPVPSTIRKIAEEVLKTFNNIDIEKASKIK